MHDAKNDNADREIITAYAPIFRDKLAKLEARGLHDTSEAAQLRTVLARVDRALEQAAREPQEISIPTTCHKTHQAA